MTIAVVSASMHCGAAAQSQGAFSRAHHVLRLRDRGMRTAAMRGVGCGLPLRSPTTIARRVDSVPGTTTDTIESSADSPSDGVARGAVRGWSTMQLHIELLH